MKIPFLSLRKTHMIYMVSLVEKLYNRVLFRCRRPRALPREPEECSARHRMHAPGWERFCPCGSRSHLASYVAVFSPVHSRQILILNKSGPAGTCRPSPDRRWNPRNYLLHPYIKSGIKAKLPATFSVAIPPKFIIACHSQ